MHLHSCSPPAPLKAKLQRLENDYETAKDPNGVLLFRLRKPGWVTMGTSEQIQALIKCAEKGCLSDPVGLDDMYHVVSVTASGEQELHTRCSS